MRHELSTLCNKLLLPPFHENSRHIIMISFCDARQDMCHTHLLVSNKGVWQNVRSARFSHENNFRRLTAAVLAATMLFSNSIPTTVFAAEPIAEAASADVQLQNGTAIIPSGSDAETVKQILFDALVVNKEEVDSKTWSGSTIAQEKMDFSPTMPGDPSMDSPAKRKSSLRRRRTRIRHWQTTVTAAIKCASPDLIQRSRYPSMQKEAVPSS